MGYCSTRTSEVQDALLIYRFWVTVAVGKDYFYPSPSVSAASGQIYPADVILVTAEAAAAAARYSSYSQ